MRPPSVFVRSLAPVEGRRLKRLSRRAKHASTRQRAMILLASATLMSPNPADNERNIAWVRETWSEIGRFGSGTYLNFIGLADEERGAGVADAFGPNLQRLAEIKSTYDPGNFFRRNNNVLAAS